MFTDMFTQCLKICLHHVLDMFTPCLKTLYTIHHVGNMFKRLNLNVGGLWGLMSGASGGGV